jgi:Arc/MetJ family transcription regulator
MRTTLDVDAQLLKTAMRRAHAKTKTEAIERGLQALIDSTRRQVLVRAGGRGYGMSVRAFLRSRLDE